MAANDIFQGGRQSDARVGGVFNGTDVQIRLGKAGGGETQVGGTNGIRGALVQNITIQYSRGINRVQELGSNDTYYIIGRSQGAFQMANIVGPTEVVTSIVDELADACKAVRTTLHVTSGTNFCGLADGSADVKKTVDFILHGPVLTQIGVSLNVGDYTINQQLAGEFATMSKGG